MHVAAAIAAAICACFGVYLNDVLSRRRTVLAREGLLGSGFDYGEATGSPADPRLARFGLLRMTANAVGLLFCTVSVLLLYRAIFADAAIDVSFWAAWASTSGAAALFFWTGR